MSTSSLTVSARKGRRRAGKPCRSSRYVPFTGTPQLNKTIDGRALVQIHLEWLIANLDYFATEGRATLHTLSRALHADLGALGWLGPVEKMDGRAVADRLQPLVEYYEWVIINTLRHYPLAISQQPDDPAKQREIQTEVFKALSDAYARIKLYREQREREQQA